MSPAAETWLISKEPCLLYCLSQSLFVFVAFLQPLLSPPISDFHHWNWTQCSGRFGLCGSFCLFLVNQCERQAKFLILRVSTWPQNSISAMTLCWDYMKLFLCLLPRSFSILKVQSAFVPPRCLVSYLDVLKYISLDCGHLKKSGNPDCSLEVPNHLLSTLQ